MPVMLAVELGDWPPLGGGVKLELAGRKTVLVGKNGAGKSILLQGIAGAAHRASVGAAGDMSRMSMAIPGRFRCEVDDGGDTLLYEYQWRSQDTVATGMDDSSLHPQGTWEERCWRPKGEELWHVQQGKVHVSGVVGLTIPDSVGLVNLRGNVPLRDKLPELYLLGNLFTRVHRIRAGMPRSRIYRSRLLATRTRDGRQTSWSLSGAASDTRMERLVMELIRATEFDGDRFAEFVEHGRRLGLWQTFSVETYEARGGTGAQQRDLLALTVDGVDIGRLPDGTLRIAEILWTALDRTSGTVLLIEEPETGVHPGLLGALLETLESCSLDRQMVLSTHSPQVVDWAGPLDLRLVERSVGKTQVRPLSQRELDQVVKYLHERSLGEYTYSGALDEDSED